MEYSWRYKATMRDIFTNSSMEEDASLSINVTHNKNNVYNHSLIIDVNNNEIELPTIARRLCENVIIKNLSNALNSKVEKVVLPLYINGPFNVRRTADSIINQFFYTSYATRLSKVKTSKGEIYYGGRGLILDKDFKPLLMCSLVGNIESNPNDKFVYKKAIIRVSPQVFLDNSKMINKSIIKKIIPFYVSEGINFCMSTSTGVISASLSGHKPQVVVEDFNRFFISPIKPKPNECSQEALNQVLIDNMDDILNYMI